MTDAVTRFHTSNRASLSAAPAAPGDAAATRAATVQLETLREPTPTSTPSRVAAQLRQATEFADHLSHPDVTTVLDTLTNQARLGNTQAGFAQQINSQTATLTPDQQVAVIFTVMNALQEALAENGRPEAYEDIYNRLAVLISKARETDSWWHLVPAPEAAPAEGDFASDAAPQQTHVTIQAQSVIIQARQTSTQPKSESTGCFSKNKKIFVGLSLGVAGLVTAALTAYNRFGLGDGNRPVSTSDDWHDAGTSSVVAGGTVLGLGGLAYAYLTWSKAAGNDSKQAQT